MISTSCDTVTVLKKNNPKASVVHSLTSQVTLGFQFFKWAACILSDIKLLLLTVFRNVVFRSKRWTKLLSLLPALLKDSADKLIKSSMETWSININIWYHTTYLRSYISFIVARKQILTGYSFPGIGWFWDLRCFPLRILSRVT